MMASMENEAGIVRRVKVGISWTAFFFEGFPFLFRQGPAGAFEQKLTVSPLRIYSKP